MYSKHLLESKVFWINLLTALGAVLVELSTLELGSVDPKWVLFALAVINIFLRTLTSQPVNVVPKSDADKP